MMVIPLGAILVALILAVLLVWLLRTLGPQIGLPPPIITVLIVAIAVIFVIWLVDALGLTGINITIGHGL